MKNRSRFPAAPNPDQRDPRFRLAWGAQQGRGAAGQCRSRGALVALIALAAAPVHAEPPPTDSFPCLIEPHLVVDASTAAEGVLAAVAVRKGDFVKQGQVVARLDSDAEEAALEQATLRAQLKAAIGARKVNLQRAIEKYDRAVKLSGNKFVSPDELDELRSAVDLARQELEEQEENRRLAEVEAKRIAAQLEERSIHSPLSGVVVERYLDAGEFAQAQPILRLAQLDPLNVEAVLPGKLYGSVREGSAARVILSEPFDETLQARVTMVEKVIDAASGTFGVRIELANPDYRIPAGLECHVNFEK